MGKNLKNRYNPDHVSLPGDTLSETIATLDMSQKELAQRIGRTPKTVNEIIKGKQAITPETALQLERVLGVPASFWNNRQRRYDEYVTRLQEEERFQSALNWVKRFPYAKMASYGWIDKTSDQREKFENLLAFLSVASPEAWQQHNEFLQVAYRRSATYAVDEYALSAWLRQGELAGRALECAPFNARAFKDCLFEARSLTTSPPSIFVPKLKEICARCGVAVVFVRELPKTASGVTRWLSSEKALIQLSLKYKTDDHLWFTFFHEAGHVLKPKKKQIFIETGDDNCAEEEANRFATEFLIPPVSWKKFPSEKRISKASIKAFAREIGVSPGIVVGQLHQQRRLDWRLYNELRRKLDWQNP